MYCVFLLRRSSEMRFTGTLADKHYGYFAQARSTGRAPRVRFQWSVCSRSYFKGVQHKLEYC